MTIWPFYRGAAPPFNRPRVREPLPAPATIPPVVVDVNNAALITTTGITTFENVVFANITAGVVHFLGTAQAPTGVNLTTEQAEAYRAEWDRQQEEWRRQVELQQQRAAQSSERARQLLVRFLNPLQLQQFTDFGWFDVTTQRGHRYRIRYGTTNNVLSLSLDDCVKAWHCTLLFAAPVYDTMLAQKMTLETDEDLFLHTAHTYYQESHLSYERLRLASGWDH